MRRLAFVALPALSFVACAWWMAGRQITTEPELSFSHDSHVQRVQGECGRCHSASVKGQGTSRPEMSMCLSCHNHQQDYGAARCNGCHPSLRHLPLQAVAEFSHTGDWQRRHGAMAQSAGAACDQCHPQATCAACHSRSAPAAPARLYPEQVEHLPLHRGDFLSMHALSARAEGDMCLRCHAQSSCDTCHQQSQLAGKDKPTPHPAGFAGGGHAREARQNLASCAACHDQGAQSSCVTCHRVGGVGGNPHPASWGDKHDSGDTRERAVCRVCHT